MWIATQLCRVYKVGALKTLVVVVVAGMGVIISDKSLSTRDPITPFQHKQKTFGAADAIT